MDTGTGDLDVKKDGSIGPASSHLRFSEVRQVHEGDVKGAQSMGDNESSAHKGRSPGDEESGEAGGLFSRRNDLTLWSKNGVCGTECETCVFAVKPEGRYEDVRQRSGVSRAVNDSGM
eukprot:8954053-Heterocapsa_arctica.AAC.1